MACRKPSQASSRVFRERLSSRKGSVHFSLCHRLGDGGAVDVSCTSAPMMWTKRRLTAVRCRFDGLKAPGLPRGSERLRLFVNALRHVLARPPTTLVPSATSALRAPIRETPHSVRVGPCFKPPPPCRPRAG